MAGVCSTLARWRQRGATFEHRSMQRLLGQLARPPFTFTVHCATPFQAWLRRATGTRLRSSERALTSTSEGHVRLQTPTWWMGC
eukprot:682181-Pyramimonas_sp.AAC.1